MTVDIESEIRPIFNHICMLYDHEIVRLIGYHEDSVDCYYHVKRPDGTTLYGSAVGWIYSLKDYLPPARYDSLDNSLSMNGCPPEPEFIVTKTDDNPFEDAWRIDDVDPDKGT